MNGWVLSTFTERGKLKLVLQFIALGNCVLSLCGGSGSLMEAAMYTGRSCIMLELNGN
jgi:hypothetical protein